MIWLICTVLLLLQMMLHLNSLLLLLPQLLHSLPLLKRLTERVVIILQLNITSQSLNQLSSCTVHITQDNWLIHKITCKIQLYQDSTYAARTMERFLLNIAMTNNSVTSSSKQQLFQETQQQLPKRQQISN